MCLKEAKLNLSVNAHALTFGRIQVLVNVIGPMGARLSLK